MVEIASLVLFSGRVETTGAFYTALGLDLEDEDHGDGPAHLATDLNGLHFAVFDASRAPGHAPSWLSAGSSFPGFYVGSLEDTLAAVTDLGAPVLSEHQVRPWGCRVVVEDPDGRPVEINQRGHCSEALTMDEVIS